MKTLVRITPDVTTKARGTRRRFTKRVVANVRAALEAAGIEADVQHTMARIFVDHDDPLALAVIRRTFGVHSLSPCKELPVESLEQLVADAAELMRERVRGGTFAVRARVRDGQIGFRSQIVNEQLGAALAEVAKVDLDHPDVTVHVEVRDKTAWIFDRSIPAEGGLPVGVGGRAVTLLSGGFDSAVAAYLLMRRGVAQDFLCLRLGGDPHERAIVAVANQLATHWAPGVRSRLVVVPFEEPVERLRAHAPPRLWQLVLKRLMYRTAEAVAARTRADAIVTGEALGQVSSQTLPNLRALDAPSGLPVLRPLLTYDKESIIALARHIGTHDVSAKVPEYCALTAERPATSAGVREVSEAEAAVPYDAGAAVREARWLELPTGGALQDDLLAERLPEGATILDLRSPPARNRRPIPEALAVEPLEVIERPDTLDATRAYGVVCDEGGRSAWFTRRLRELGFHAWSVAPDAV